MLRALRDTLWRDMLPASSAYAAAIIAILRFRHSAAADTLDTPFRDVFAAALRLRHYYYMMLTLSMMPLLMFFAIFSCHDGHDAECRHGAYVFFAGVSLSFIYAYYASALFTPLHAITLRHVVFFFASHY